MKQTIQKIVEEKNLIIFYHGSSKENCKNIKKEGFKNGCIRRWYGDYFGVGVYITNDLTNAKDYAGEKGDIIKVEIPNHLKLLNVHLLNDINVDLFNDIKSSEVTKKLMAKGYDGIKVTGFDIEAGQEEVSEITIFNSKNVKVLK